MPGDTDLSIPSAEEAEAEGLQVQGLPELQRVLRPVSGQPSESLS